MKLFPWLALLLLLSACQHPSAPNTANSEKRQLLNWDTFKEEVLAEFQLAENAIPPCPPAKHRLPLYPFGSVDRGKNGDCEVIFVVDKDGSVSDIYLVGSTGPSFAAYTERAVREWKFESVPRNQIYRAFFEFEWVPPNGASIVFSGSPYYQKGQAKYWRKDYAGAILDLSQSILSESPKAGAYYYRGLSKHKQNAPGAAIDDFDASLKLNRTSMTLISRGRSKFLKGDLTGALDDLNESTKLEAASGLTLCWRGRVKMALNDFQGALADYAASLKKDPELTSVYFDMGVAQQVLGDYAAALRYYEKANSFPQPVEDTIYARILRALLLERTGKSSVSGELSSHINSWTGDWQKNLGLYFIGKISGEELLRRSTLGTDDRLSAQRCEAFYYIGISHLLAGEKPEAKQAFENCIEVKGTTVSERLLARAELKNL